MPQALIKINAVIGSDDDLPLDTLVQLDNENIGGEVTYLWEILDQPAGTPDVSSPCTISGLGALLRSAYLVLLIPWRLSR